MGEGYQYKQLYETIGGGGLPVQTQLYETIGGGRATSTDTAL